MYGGRIPAEFNKDIGQYAYETDGLIFVWDEEPTDGFMDTVKMLSKNYYEHLNSIIDFILPDIKETYGNVSSEDVRNNLGKPIIDYDRGRVSYCEQTFADCHIFEFEFLDDKFEEVQYFSMNG